jgi:hypothetical protein
MTIGHIHLNRVEAGWWRSASVGDDDFVAICLKSFRYRKTDTAISAGYQCD